MTNRSVHSPHAVNCSRGRVSKTGWSSRLAGFSALALMGILLTGPAPVFATDISYVYDNLGRVLAVIDPATDTAVYVYDAVGNLTGITRQTSSTLAIFQFTPSSGPVGTAVTIYGTGFSATPASNTVQFNGTTATVATASTTVLTTTVPAGATTGTISVTVAGITATSAASFTVGTGGAPTLSSFSPAVAGYGATVTLTGTNYDTTLINNRVAFTAAIGAVATATSTSITVPVPGSAQTGPISVSTTQGNATSALEFYVAPPGVVVTDIQYTGRITVNGPTVTPSIITASTNGLLVFDGVAGPRLSLGLSSPTITQFAVSVYRPDGGEIHLCGRRTDKLRPHEITARGIARTFQIPKLFGHMTVLENVLLPALAALDRGAGGALPDITERARRLLDFVTLDRLRHAPAKELSGGQSMLIQIARALMVRPLHLILMDEPFAGVHPSIRDIILEAILKMNREEEITFLIVSHEMAELRRLCQQISVMDEGRLIAEGTLEEVANDPRVLEAYLGP